MTSANKAAGESASRGWLDAKPYKEKIFYGGLAVAVAFAIIGAIGVGAGAPILAGKSLWGLAEIITSFWPVMPYLMTGAGAAAILPILGYMLYGVVKLIQCRPSKLSDESAHVGEGKGKIGEEGAHLPSSLSLSDKDFELHLSQLEIPQLMVAIAERRIGQQIVIYKKSEDGQYAYRWLQFNAQNEYVSNIGSSYNSIEELIQELNNLPPRITINNTRASLEGIIGREALEGIIDKVKEVNSGGDSLSSRPLKEDDFQKITEDEIGSLLTSQEQKEKFKDHVIIYKTEEGYGYIRTRFKEKEKLWVWVSVDKAEVDLLEKALKKNASNSEIINSLEELKEIVGREVQINKTQEVATSAFPTVLEFLADGPLKEEHFKETVSKKQLRAINGLFCQNFRNHYFIYKSDNKTKGGYWIAHVNSSSQRLCVEKPLEKIADLERALKRNSDYRLITSFAEVKQIIGEKRA